MIAKKIEQEVTMIETHLTGIMQKVSQLEARLQREREKADILLAENRRLQEQAFDLKKRAGLFDVVPVL